MSETQKDSVHFIFLQFIRIIQQKKNINDIGFHLHNSMVCYG